MIVGTGIFLVGPEEIVPESVYYFFNCFPDRFWNSIYLSSVPTIVLIKGFAVPNMIFLLNCQIFCPSSCYHRQNFENKLQPFLMENCNQVICLGLSILFLHATPHKVWLFEKFIFELEAF